MTDWIKITSKYPNHCVTCGEAIEVDEVCLWSKGVGVKHEDCPISMLEYRKSIEKAIIENPFDVKKYTMVELRDKRNCQDCGIELIIGSGNMWVEEERRLCEACWSRLCEACWSRVK